MGLLDKATIITTPTAHSNGKLHSIKGGAVADFDVVRGSAATRVNAEGLIEDISVLSGELVTNGDFVNGSTGWSKGTGWSIENGSATLDGTQNAASALGSSGMSVVSGKTYKIVVNVLSKSSGFRIYDTDGVLAYGLSVGENVFYKTVSSATYQITPLGLSGSTGSITNISIKEVIDATNIPRIDYTTGEGVILTEPQSTNLVVNSELNNVENIVVSAVSYTISFYGTGSITLSGTHTATLVGTGASDRVSLTFTPAAGTLICTDSGIVDKKQLEALSYSTSYIPTSGAIATRLADAVTGAGDATTINSTEGVLYAEIAALANDGTNRAISIDDGSLGNSINLFYTGGISDNSIRALILSGSITQATMDYTLNVTDNHKIAISYAENNFALWVDGVKVLTDSSGNAPIGLNNITFSQGGGGSPFYGKTKTIAVFSEALTDEELTCLTTI